MKLWILNIFFNAFLRFQTWRKIRETRRVFALTSNRPVHLTLLPAFAESMATSTVAYPINWKDYRGYAYAVILAVCGFLIFNFFPNLDFLKRSEFSFVISEDPAVILPDPLTAIPAPDTSRALIEEPDKDLEDESNPKYSILPEGLHLAIGSKWDKTLRLYTLKKYRWYLTKEWSLLYGRQEGNKKKKGDMKTPEGNYWVKNILPGPNVGSLYGALIFTLNYPNKKDYKEGNTGGGIWIHGNEFGTELQTTRGCIKLSNKSILEMFSYVKSSIPVMILSGKNNRIKPEQQELAWIEREYGRHVYTSLKPYRDTGRQFTLEEIETIAQNFVIREEKFFTEHPARELNDKEITEIMQSIEEWKNAWSEREFSDYALSYHRDFKSRSGTDKKSYLSRKKGILSVQDSIRIQLEGIEIKPIKDSSASVKFSQHYKSYKSGQISHASVTQKDLWLKKTDGKWLIIKE